MPEVTPDQLNARFKQFDTAIKAALAEGGTIVSGIVTQKSNWPAKEGKSPSWSVVVAYFGGSSRVTVSQRLHDSIGIGSYWLFQVTQRAKDNSIYITAIES
ncbi:MAG: hypothetical protein ACTFAK_11085 [Candidatus Electronema sp. VV]